MYEAQRAHGQIEGDRPLGLMLCISRPSPFGPTADETSNSKSPTKAGAPYLAFFWRDVGGMYQAQRAHGQIEGDRPLRLMPCISRPSPFAIHGG
jgi:hypothetical protein